MAIETSDKVLHIPSTASELPAGWTWRRLDDICEGIFDCPHSTPKLTLDGPYVVRSQDIRSGVFRVEEAGRVSEETYSERIKRVEPRHGDLLYSREGTYFGIAAEVPKDIRVCLGQRMVLIRPEAKYVNFRFLRYWLNSPVLAAHIYGHRDGTVAERLNLPTIRGLPVPVSPLDEQKAIAHILGTLDDKIELNQQMNQTLEAIARALFKSWFIDFDPVRAKMDGQQPAGMDAETAALFPNEFEDSPLGKIPKGWKAVRWGDITTLEYGKSLRGYQEAIGPYRVYGTNGPIGWHTEALCNHSGIIIGRKGAYRGVHYSPHPFFVIDTAFYLKPKIEFDWIWAYYELIIFDINSLDSGSAIPSTSRDDFYSIPVCLPAPKVLDAFGKQMKILYAKREADERESQTLIAIRDALLPKLLSGEIHVKETEKILEEAA